MEVRTANLIVTVVFVVLIILTTLVFTLRRYRFARDNSSRIILAIVIVIVIAAGWWLFYRKAFFAASRSPNGCDGAEDAIVTPTLNPVVEDGCSSKWERVRSLGLKSGDCLNSCSTGGLGFFFVDSTSDEIVYRGICSRSFMVNMSVAAATTINERRIELCAARIVTCNNASASQRIEESSIVISNVFTLSNPCVTSGTTFVMTLSPGDRVGFIARLAPGNDEGGVMLQVRTFNISLCEI